MFTGKASTEPEQTQQSRWVFVVSGLLVGGGGLAYFLMPSVQHFTDEAVRVLTSDDQARIERWVSGFGAWGPILIILMMIAQMFLVVIPSVVLMVVATLAYGPWWGSLLSVVAVLLASSVAYYIGWHAGHAVVDKIIGEKSEKKMNKYIQKYGAWVIVLFRVTPFLSNDAISFAAGIGQMSYLKFIAATAIGIAPLVAVIAYAGQDTDTLERSMIGISVATVVGLGGYLLYRKTKRS